LINKNFYILKKIFFDIQAAETTFSVNVISTVASNIHQQNSFKNQTSAVQTQTQTSTAAMPVTSQNLNPTTSIAIPSNSNNNYINNITVSKILL